MRNGNHYHFYLPKCVPFGTTCYTLTPNPNSCFGCYSFFVWNKPWGSTKHSIWNTRISCLITLLLSQLTLIVFSFLCRVKEIQLKCSLMFGQPSPPFPFFSSLYLRTRISFDFAPFAVCVRTHIYIFRCPFFTADTTKGTNHDETPQHEGWRSTPVTWKR